MNPFSFLTLSMLCLGWGVLCGAVVYEHLAVIPQWTREPPVSLTMWNGPFGLKAERFWMAIHPLLLLLLAGALVLEWEHPQRRLWLGVTAGAYAVIIAATVAYYVPELLKLTREPQAPIPPPEWRRRARRWELWSFPRSALVLVLAFPLLFVLSTL